MPQNPVDTGLFVSQVKVGPGLAVSPAHGTGVVTLSAATGVGTSVPQQKYVADATAPTTNNLNLSTADVAGGSVLQVLNLTAALGAGATATLPTVAALVAALAALGIDVVAGSSYELDLINSSAGAFDWTITTNTGWTLTGTMTVAQNTMRKCIITFTSLTAATLQSLGEIAVTAV